MGDPTNVAVWDIGRVFLSWEEAPANPASIEVPFGPDWDAVGLLLGSAGIPETPTSTATDHSAWGYGVVAETERDHKISIGFTALEDNPIVRKLVYPVDTGDTGGVEVVRFGPAVPCWIGIEFDYGSKRKRNISRQKCKVRRAGAMTRNEDALEQYPFEATILPDAVGHWIVQQTEAVSS